MPVEFDPSNHSYTFEGRSLPSVTGILRDAGLVDFSMVDPVTLSIAAERGTRVHEWCRRLDDDHTPAESIHFDRGQDLGYCTAYAMFKSETGFTVTSSETIVHHGTRYAGRYDRLGVIRGQLVILEIKCVREIAAATGLQLAAYLRCIPDYRAYRRVAVQLRPDGSYRVREWLPGSLAADIATFDAVCVVAGWRRANGLTKPS
jgi:hypothetical protein